MKIKRGKKVSYFFIKNLFLMKTSRPSILLTSLISCGLSSCTLSNIDILFGNSGKNEIGQQPTVPVAQQAESIYLPLSNKFSIANSSTGNDTTLLYNSAVIDNTHYILYGDPGMADQPSQISILSTSTENHFVVVPHFVSTAISIFLGEGDDTVYFESYGIKNSMDVGISLGNGKNRLVLKGALLEAANINLGTGQSKIYLSPLKNFSSLSLDKSLHKIVLTEGMTFNDLEFTEDSNFLFINLKPKKDHEIYSVPLLKITKNSGGFNSLSDINDSSLFEVGEIQDLKYGIFYPTTKYPKKPVLVDFATNPISYQVNQFIWAPDVRPNTYNDYYTSTVYNLTSLFGKTISSNYFVDTLLSPSTPVTTDTDYLPLYQIADPLLPDDYIRYQFDASTLATKDKYISLEYDNRIFTKANSDGNVVYIYNPSNFILKAYPHHHTNIEFLYQAPFTTELLNTYVDLNGKQTGTISSLYSPNIFLHVFLSRQGSGAIISSNNKNRLLFHLGDNIKLSDLILTSANDIIDVKIKDDTNTEITIASINVQSTPDINLAEISSNLSSYFVEDPETIDGVIKLPAIQEI